MVESIAKVRLRLYLLPDEYHSSSQLSSLHPSIMPASITVQNLVSLVHNFVELVHMNLILTQETQRHISPFQYVCLNTFNNFAYNSFLLPIIRRGGHLTINHPF